LKDGPAPPELTVQAVRAVFRAVLRGSDKVPGPDACRDVTAWLQFLRLRRTRPAVAMPADKVEKAALALIAELEAREKIYALFPAEIARVPTLPFLEEALRAQAVRRAALRAAHQALARVLPLLALPAPDGAPHGAGWHDEAVGLYRVFLAAMREANPGRRYAPSNEGAAVRFIRAAFALALGEERREAAIAKALKRRRAGTERDRHPSRDRR